MLTDIFIKLLDHNKVTNLLSNIFNDDALHNVICYAYFPLWWITRAPFAWVVRSSCLWMLNENNEKSTWFLARSICVIVGNSLQTKHIVKASRAWTSKCISQRKITFKAHTQFIARILCRQILYEIFCTLCTNNNNNNNAS